ncbi:putative peptide hydrolase [Lyophyllum shimeji]|uniref:Peptide hydrolase n=1 Tax=Lyophyllum shimeji TaxID=47721 RepID=A0A9P3UQN6_LYOSH|nr:putative peptide hydrolase [Lyophyllum shimeji]
MDEVITKRLHISGLTLALTADDISKRLSTFGTVKAVDGFGLLDGVGQPRKFGYVTLETTQAKLARCLNLLSGSTWKGAKLRIGEAKLDYAERLAAEREAASEEPPKKKRRHCAGVEAPDMSLVTPENVTGRGGWKVTPLGRIVRPVRMRPEHPLPPPEEDKDQRLGKKGGEEKKKKKQRVKEPDVRARRRTIDVTRWGSVHLKGMFLDMEVLGTKRDVGDVREREDVVEDEASESASDVEALREGIELEKTIADDVWEPPPSFNPKISTPPPPSTIVPVSTVPTTHPLPADAADLAAEKSHSLSLLASLFGNEPDADWVGRESVGSDIDEAELASRHQMVVDAEDVEDFEVVPMNADTVDIPSDEEADDDEDAEQADHGMEAEVETHTPVPPPPPQSQKQQQATKLKDLFAPREEDAGFSLLGHLDFDLELDEEVPFAVTVDEPTQVQDLTPAPVASLALPSSTSTHAQVLHLDPKAPLFFPLPGSSASGGTKRPKDILGAAKEGGWSWRDPAVGFFRTETEDEIRKRWEEKKGELTREWKRRWREAGKTLVPPWQGQLADLLSATTMLPPRLGPIRSLLLLSPVLILAPYLAWRQHAALPEPLTELNNPLTGLPQISEARIRAFAKYLSEDIGYRTVGTQEHALADKWMVEQAEAVRRNCEEVVAATGRKLECEVWHQEGSGSHRFDMMNQRLYKTYVDLTNIVVRISDGTPEGKEHAVLVNAHLDSTLPSPGAADDAISVGVMLDCMRVLVNTPGWSPKHAIVFLFNHAEESLQDGSHLFSTQHPIAPTVRAVINLEAAGTTGREILFQATSHEMISAYSHVPRPFGTIFANDIFSSGIILSDTDFRQFEEYLNVTGLDMAIVGNSYLYHMRKDLVENLQPGVAQNMAENTLALLRYLSAAGSPIPTLTTYTRPTTVFFSYLGHFFIYSFTTAKIMYTALLVASIVLVVATYNDPAPALRKGRSVWSEQARGLRAVVAGLLGCVLVPNLVALVMMRVLGKGMSWFANEYSAMVLYVPAALLGTLLSQVFVGPVPEQTLFTAILLLETGICFVMQMLGIGSAAVFFLAAFPLFIALLLNPLFSGSTSEIALSTYGLGQAFPLFGGVLLLLPVVEVFVPLTGRIGADAPADHVIATIISSIGALSLPLVLPFAHRFGPRALWRGVLFAGMLTALAIAVFAMRMPFNAMHQKRVYILHTENITTHEHHLHIAAADAAPGFDLFAADVVSDFLAPRAKVASDDPSVSLMPVVMDEYNSDWDPLYPFSKFLKTYKVPLAVDPGYVSPWTVTGNGLTIKAVNDVKDLAAGTRSLTLQINHPGLIWTVVAFDAHVLKWSLDNNPPDEYARHRVKEASFYGKDTWSIDLVVKLDAGAGDGGLVVNFMGLQEKGMWPAKKAVKEQGGVAMTLFEELDAWVETKTEGTVDVLLMGCVAGVVEV